MPDLEISGLKLDRESAVHPKPGKICSVPSRTAFSTTAPESLGIPEIMVAETSDSGRITAPEDIKLCFSRCTGQSLLRRAGSPH